MTLREFIDYQSEKNSENPAYGDVRIYLPKDEAEMRSAMEYGLEETIKENAIKGLMPVGKAEWHLSIDDGKCYMAYKQRFKRLVGVAV